MTNLKSQVSLLAAGLILAGLGLSAAQNDQSASDKLFTNDTVFHLRIEIPEAAIESLRTDPRAYVEATVKEGGVVYSNVLIHLKGSVGSFRKVDDKPGLTLNFKSAEPQSSFYGLKKLHLNNTVQDSTYLSEWISSDLFRKAGLPATRAAHAVVDLNERKLGLYVLVEGVDRVFLARYFQNTRGNLYGQSENGDITENLARMEGRGEDTHADLKALAEVARENDLAKLQARLPTVLDVEEFIDFMAMEVMLCHWDGYSMAIHNFRVYHNPDTGKITFIPHDLDQTIGDPNLPIRPPAHGLIARDILKLPELRARYRERFGTLFTNVFLVSDLTNRIDKHVARMMPALTDYDLGIALSFQNHSKAMKARIINRRHALEQQFIMPEPANLVLEGKVQDGETRKPIPQFMIVPGFHQAGNAVTWDRTHIFRAVNGAFNMDLSMARLPQMPGFLRFEADGYQPHIVTYQLSTNAADAKYEIALKKGKKITVLVRLPDGAPARGAQTAMLTETSSLVLGRAELLAKPGVTITRLLDRGRYVVTPDPEAQSVVAVHDTGFAEALLDDLSAQPQPLLNLLPWGRIEGAMQGKDSSAPSTVAVVTSELLIPNLFNGIYAGGLNLDFNTFTVEAPSDGAFAIEKVPPGERYLWRSVPIDSPTNTSLSNLSFVGQRVMVKPGETNQVVWGGNERMLKGRIILGEATNEAAGNGGSPEANDAPSPFKLGFLKLTPVASNTAPPAEFIFTFGEKDAFCVGGVLPGNYVAEFRVYSPPLLLGTSAQKKILIPDSPKEATPAAFDLGNIEFQLLKPAKIGDPAPEFPGATLDGKPFNLADFRGSFVLLSFWASWCGPLNTVVPKLKAVWDEFHNDPRLIMVGLNLDRQSVAAQRYARRNDMPWRQGYLGEWFQTSVPAAFGVAGIPAAVLIGPDGKILAQNMDITNLASAVKQALKK